MDRSLTQPPLLPLPASPSLPVYQPHIPLSSPSLHSTSSSSTPRLPKIEVPLFSAEHMLSWLFQINHFFHFHQIPDDQRISIAAFYLIGQALQWFQWLHSTSQLSHWDDFVWKLELRFGPSSFIQSHLATHLKLVVQPSSHKCVTVGNCEAFTCGGECSVVPLKVGNTIFSVDLIFLPIYSVECVLGI